MSQRLSVLPASDTTRRHALAINQLSKNCEPFLYSDGVQTVSASIDLGTGFVFKIATVQVVGPRITGWTAATGTPARGAFAAVAAGTASVGYVQAELQGALNRIAALEARLIALQADLTTHGLIGV